MTASGVEEREQGGVQVVERVAAILVALRDERDGLSLSQISAKVGLARSTVHRLVSALEREGLVASASAAGGFRLGPVIASLAASANREIVVVVHPYLLRLSRELNETVDLAVLERDRVLFIDQVAAERRLHAVSSAGSIFPAHCTANGKALLALLDDDELVRRLPSTLEPFTPNTLTSREDLLAEIREIRRDGYAFDREEHTIGICAVGATIGGAGTTRAAVSVPIPAQRFEGNEMALSETLLRACRLMDEALEVV